MPKTAADGRPSMYNGEGEVADATGGRWQLDPSRNYDGTAVDGFESDERVIDEDAATPGVNEAPQLQQPVDKPAPVEDEKDKEPKAKQTSSVRSTRR